MKRNDYMAMLYDAARITKEYGFENETVYPYGYPEKVETMIKRCADYDLYTTSSKELLTMELKGLYELLKKWEQSRKSRRLVRYNGKVKNLTPEFIEMLIEEGFEIEYL